jgi:hypothetical protein
MAGRALRTEDQAYAQKLANMAKKHSSENFYALDVILSPRVSQHLLPPFPGPSSYSGEWFRAKYEKRSMEASAVETVRMRGISLSPGMEVGYIVEDAGPWKVNVEEHNLEGQSLKSQNLGGRASQFYENYYFQLLEMAWKEISFAFGG